MDAIALHLAIGDLAGVFESTEGVGVDSSDHNKKNERGCEESVSEHALKGGCGYRVLKMYLTAPEISRHQGMLPKARLPISTP